jgi:hypothetical protein
VFGHHGAKEIEFKGQVGMPGSNHFVIDKLVRRPHVTRQASFAAHDQISGVVHAELNGLFMRPILCGVRTQPPRGWTMAAFAANPINQLEGFCALFGWHGQGVTS